MPVIEVTPTCLLWSSAHLAKYHCVFSPSAVMYYVLSSSSSPSLLHCESQECECVCVLAYMSLESESFIDRLEVTLVSQCF